MKKEIVIILLCMSFLLPVTGKAQMKNKTAKFLLAGTWELEAAEVLHPDGTRVTDTSYGANAKGLLMVDEEGRYSLQIFRPDRPRFASGDKKRGTPQEYEVALLGISTHIGHIFVDTAQQTLQFTIDYAAYPNWEHTTQVRQYKLVGDKLFYQVPATAGAGTVAISAWRRVK